MKAQLEQENIREPLFPLLHFLVVVISMHFSWMMIQAGSARGIGK